MNANNDKVVYIYTQTYDIAEPYIERMLESIRNQSYPFFRCYIYDNCSQKKAVHEIIEKFASNDERFLIRKVFDDKVKVFSWDWAIPEIINSAGGEGYFTIVDADDELEKNALERMVRVLEEKEVDMVCGGAYFMDGNTGKVLGNRCSEEEYIIEGKGFGEKFPNYYQLMRTHWAKMTRMSVLDKVRIMQIPRPPYGIDTIFVRELLLQSDRVMVIPDIVYRYYLYESPKTYNADPRRISSPREIYLNDLHFLLQKVGSISQHNINFLLTIYIYETEDVISLVLNQKGEVKEKIDLLFPLLVDDENRVIFRNMYGKVYEKLGSWIINSKFYTDEETFDKVVSILGTMGFVPAELTCYSENVLFKLLTKMDCFVLKSNLKKALRLKILEIIKQNAICKHLSILFIIQYSDLIYEILEAQYRSAINMINQYLSQEYGYMWIGKDDLVDLGLTISSILKDEEQFVAYKKIQISLWSENKKEMAKQELKEWIEILPDDKEFRELLNNIDKDG